MSSLAALPELSELIPDLLFFIFAGVAIVAAMAAAVAPKIVHAAFGLMATFFMVAALYAMLGADFVALAQVIVYVGGILVLLVFGVLLTARTEIKLGVERGSTKTFAVLAGGLLFLVLLLAIGGTTFPTPEKPAEPEPTTADIGRAFLDPDGMLIPFELASVLLLAALVGAAYLARRRRSDA
ncbi:MAG: NADH-quinone oxidoreductase subunit J [Planctomycetota bacterium]|nr:NADH-quinone oxidoreductase subunit J [Planctomycetota bacterium]